MMRFVPGRREWMLFAAMALICAIIVQLCPSREGALAMCAMPVFLVASLLGQRRNWLLADSKDCEAADSDA